MKAALCLLGLAGVNAQSDDSLFCTYPYAPQFPKPVGSRRSGIALRTELRVLGPRLHHGGVEGGGFGPTPKVAVCPSTDHHSRRPALAGAKRRSGKKRAGG